jgi:hypothetical protein
MHALMPIFFKVMNFEKVMGREQRYQIDWDAPAMDGTPDDPARSAEQALWPPRGMWPIVWHPLVFHFWNSLRCVAGGALPGGRGSLLQFRAAPLALV